MGLSAALALARAGARVTLFEKRETPNIASKGSSFHPPTLEILDELGAAAPALRAGVHAGTIDYYDRRRRAARLDMRLIADLTRFPFRLHLEQSQITLDLLAALRQYSNAAVRFSAGVMAAETTASGVRARLEDGTTMDADLLVAADGSKSTLRRHLGIAFEGSEYGSRVLRLFTRADLAQLIPGIAPVAYLYDGARSVSALKLAQGWRILVRIAQGQSDDDALADDHVRQRLADTFGAEARGLPLASKDVYAASRRVAASYREGRIVLAGDAAHVTNTRGGMNMNCGIHDAYELAQAIARIRAGAMAEAELDGYARKRRRVAAEQLLPVSDRAVSGEAGRVAEMAAIAQDPAAARAYLIAASLLDTAPRVTPWRQTGRAR